ncbi:MAG: TIM barrel protein, partial [Kiritimatiellae bacterium]|nr:TIM barrel protein [Kiritimatiellia bacterium]
MRIGCHLSSSGGYLAMAQTAESIGANVFQFFTRNPRGGAAKPIDKRDVAAFIDYAKEKGIGPILAHAPYTLNAAGAEQRVRDFAEDVMVDDLKRLELTPGAMYNFHPGSHVGQGTEKGVELIAGHLNRVFTRVCRDLSISESGE